MVYSLVRLQASAQEGFSYKAMHVLMATWACGNTRIGNLPLITALGDVHVRTVTELSHRTSDTHHHLRPGKLQDISSVPPPAPPPRCHTARPATPPPAA